MQIVRRGVVNHLNVRIVEELLVAAVRPACAERFRFPVGGRLVAARDRDHVDVAKTPHGVDVMRADEARTDDTHPDPFHDAPPMMMARIIRSKSILQAATQLKETPGAS